MNTTDLIEKAETLQNLLVARATGEGADPAVYSSLRQELMNNHRTKNKLPRFVKTCRSLDHFWSFIKYEFSTYAERRQFIWQEFSPLLNDLEQGVGSPAAQETSAVLSSLDADHVHALWQRALERRNADPEGAVTLSRTLIESVCKLILDEQEIDYSDKADLPKLYYLTAEQLDLAPSQHSEELFRKILGNCQAVVGGLGAIRNIHSDAHGDGKVKYKPAPRHAELAVNLAGSMATFLTRTWQEGAAST